MTSADMASTPPKRRKGKRGRKPYLATTDEGELVMLGVAIGMSVEMISAAIGMPRRSLYRTYRAELANGRAKRLLASAARLDALANAGNAACAKYLHGLMTEKGAADEVEDTWSDVVGAPRSNLAQIRDLN